MTESGQSSFNGSNPPDEGNSQKLPPISFFSSSLTSLNTEIPDLPYFGGSSYSSPNKTYGSPQMMCSPILSSNAPPSYPINPSSSNTSTNRAFARGKEERAVNYSKSSTSAGPSSSNSPVTAKLPQETARVNTNSKDSREFESVPNSPRVFPVSRLPSPKSVPNLRENNGSGSNNLDDHDACPLSNRSDDLSYTVHQEKKDAELNVKAQVPSTSTKRPVIKVDDVAPRETFPHSFKARHGTSIVFESDDKPKEYTSKTPKQTMSAQDAAVDAKVKEIMQKHKPNIVNGSKRTDEATSTPKKRESKSSLLVDLLTSKDDNSSSDAAKVVPKSKVYTVEKPSEPNIHEAAKKNSGVKNRNDFHAIIEHKPLPISVANVRRNQPVGRPMLPVAIVQQPLSSAQLASHEHSSAAQRRQPLKNMESGRGAQTKEQYGSTSTTRTRVVQQILQRQDISPHQQALPSSSYAHSSNSKSSHTVADLHTPASTSYLPQKPSNAWISAHADTIHSTEKEKLSEGSLYTASHSVSYREMPKEEVNSSSYARDPNIIVPERIAKLFPQVNDIEEPTPKSKKDSSVYKTIIDYLVKENEEYRNEIGRLQTKLNGLQGELTCIMKELSKMINASDDSDSSQETIIDEPKKRRKSMGTRRRRKTDKIDSAEISRSPSPDFSVERKLKPGRRKGTSKSRRAFPRARRSGNRVPAARRKHSPSVPEEDVDIEEPKVIPDPAVNLEELVVTPDIKRTRQRRKNSDDPTPTVSEPKRRRQSSKIKQENLEAPLSSLNEKVEDESVTPLEGEKDTPGNDAGEDQPKMRRSSRRSVRNRFLATMDDSYGFERPSSSKEVQKSEAEARSTKESSVSSESKQ